MAFFSTPSNNIINNNIFLLFLIITFDKFIFIKSLSISKSQTSSSSLSVSSFLNDPSLLLSSSIIIKEDGGNNERKKTFDVLNPATDDDDDNGLHNAVIANIEIMTRKDTQQAIERAASALPSWRDETTGYYRSKILTRWGELIEENIDDLARIMILETGKPLLEARGEILYGKAFVDFYAGEAIRPTSSGGGVIIPTPFTMPTDSRTPRGKVMAVKEAIGVTAMITPWNFPSAMITRKVAPALAAGCTVVVKPSELTPLSAIALKVLAHRAGVPPDGVFELVTPDTANTPEVGMEMCENEHVKKISFTGSTRIGKLLAKQCSETVKRVSLELGGNAAFIVFDDADIDQAVNAAMASKFRNAGQTCVCADRFLLHKSIEEEFLSKFIERVRQIQVGPSLSSINNNNLEQQSSSTTTTTPTMGPLITEQAASSIYTKIQECLHENDNEDRAAVELLVGGSRLLHIGPNFLEPTILRNVPISSRLWQTETFGPVAAIRTFETDEEALTIANDTPYGLASYFCTRNMERAFRVAGQLQNGVIGINEGIISTATAPFGGFKQSGIGREGGSEGIDEFLETKYILLNT